MGGETERERENRVNIPEIKSCGEEDGRKKIRRCWGKNSVLHKESHQKYHLLLRNYDRRGLRRPISCCDREVTGDFSGIVCAAG